MKRFVTLILLLLLWGMASARVIHVPEDFPVIMDAVAVAVDGDTVLLAPGTYSQSVRLTASITLRGESRFTTAILSDSRPAVAVDADSAKIESLSLTGGSAALLFTRGFSTLRDLDISSSRGTGLSSTGSAEVELRDCRIQDSETAFTLERGRLMGEHVSVRRVSRLGILSGGTAELTQSTCILNREGWLLGAGSRVNLNSCAVNGLAGAVALRNPDLLTEQYTDFWQIGSSLPLLPGVDDNEWRDPLFTESIPSWTLTYEGLHGARDTNYVVTSACWTRVELSPEELDSISRPDGQSFQVMDYCFHAPQIDFYRRLPDSIDADRIFAVGLRLTATGGSHDASGPVDIRRIGLRADLVLPDTLWPLCQYTDTLGDTSLVSLVGTFPAGLRGVLDSNRQFQIVLSSLYSSGDWGYGFLKVDNFELFLLGTPDSLQAQPSPLSPLIDSGDPALAYDPDGSPPDRGANPYHHSGWVPTMLPDAEWPIWPNPLWDILSASLPPRPGRIEIRDLLGRPILSESSAGGPFSVNLRQLGPAGLTDGTYFLTWHDSSDRRFIRRFTVMAPRN